jgi:hypothetical protein
MSTLRSALAVAVVAASALVVNTAHAAQGCGPNGWRGTWGHCHYAPPVYVAPRPVIYAVPPVSTYACPPGYWRARGVIAATRHITAACRTADGNERAQA